jgi:hypothetical protein
MTAIREKKNFMAIIGIVQGKFKQDFNSMQMVDYQGIRAERNKTHKQKIIREFA